MRLDVREALERAAHNELYVNGNYVALVAREVVEQHDPDMRVSIAFAPDATRPGMLEVIVTDHAGEA